MEVVFVLIIMGIMTAVAVPTLRRSVVERGYWRQAQDVLLTIYTGERMYFFRNGAYYNMTDPNDNVQWRQIDMDNPNFAAVAFSVSAAGIGPGATFTATADRGGGLTRTINQGRTFGGSWPQP